MPGPGGVLGGSHPASSLLGLGVGGGSPLGRSLRGVDGPHPGTRWGIGLGQSQGPQICCRSPGLAASAQILGAFQSPCSLRGFCAPTVLLLWGLCGIRAAQSHPITPTPAVALSSF